MIRCDVDTGGGAGRARMIELERKGDGVVGRDITHGEVANGNRCDVDADDVVRAPWWRG